MREERLRATAELRGSLTWSSWRGRSGRRYVVGVHPFGEADILDLTDAVVIAVSRDRDGIGRAIDVAAAGTRPREGVRRSWMSAVRARGATEMHVHHLAEGEAESRTVVADLRMDG